MVVYLAEVEGGCVAGAGRRSPCNGSLGDASASVGTVSVVVKWMVRWAVSAEVNALQVVSVANTAVKLSPTGKLNAGMSDRAVIVRRAIEVPVATAEVPKSLSPPIPPVATVSSIRARASSDKRKIVKV